MIEAKEVSFGSIVPSFSVRMEEGGIIAIIGPNGAGKTTVLKMLAGFLTPTHGEIQVRGLPLRQLSAKKRAHLIGYLPQQTVIDLAYSVRDIVEMGFYSHLRYPKKDEVDRVLEATTLLEFADRSVRTLSGGERQRVFFAKMLAQDPAIFLLDEPVTGLDIAYQEDMLRLCKKMSSQKKTVIITLHDLEHVLRFADRVILMDHGEVQADGLPQNVLTGDVLSTVFGVESHVFADPFTGLPRLSIAKTEGRTGRHKLHSAF